MSTPRASERVGGRRAVRRRLPLFLAGMLGLGALALALWAERRGEPGRDEPTAHGASTLDAATSDPAPRPGQSAIATGDAERRPAPPASLEVHGTIEDPQGRPIAGARVDVALRSLDPSPLAAARGVTDAQGDYSIALRADATPPTERRTEPFLRVEAHAPGFRPGIASTWGLPPPGGRARIDLSLVPGDALTGRVVDVSGAAVAGADVYLTRLDSLDGAPSLRVTRRVPSAEDGGFALEIEPDTRFRLRARKPGVGSADGGWLHAGGLPAGPLLLELRLAQPARCGPASEARDEGAAGGLTLRLVTADGRALEPRLFALDSEGQPGAPAAAVPGGRPLLSAPLAPGTYELAIELPGHRPHRQRIVLLAAEITACSAALERR